MKLITWNIQWGRGADGRVDLDRIVRHAQRLADFDVLCLQEVSSGHDRLAGCDGVDQFEQLAARLPDHAPVIGIATELIGADGTPRRFGNMILSRLPVRQVFRHLLPWPADAGVKSMQRVVVEASLETAFGPLRVATTHLEYHAVRQRAAQIERLRELHREAAAHARSSRPGTAADGPFESVPRPLASVLTGDFNMRAGSPEYAQLIAPIDADTPPYLDAWLLRHPDRPHDPTVGVHDRVQWPGPPFACDFVFVSADLSSRVREVQVDASTEASDHQPVLIELT